MFNDMSYFYELPCFFPEMDIVIRSFHIDGDVTFGFDLESNS